MNDKPVPPRKPRTVHCIGMDAASTLNFQSLGPKKNAPANGSTNKKPAVPGLTKTGVDGKGK